MKSDIIVCNITKQYGNKLVLNQLNAVFPYGKITCIMGPSGCGKTTLLNLLLGLEIPDAGLIQGMEHLKLAAVFQEDRLCEEFDAITNVKMAVGEEVSITEIQEHFRLVELTDYEGKPVSNLSGGMRRRVAIVRAILAKSDLLIMDEPLKGLDARLKQKVLYYLKSVIEGKTVIMVTHDIEETQFLADKILEFGEY